MQAERPVILATVAGTSGAPSNDTAAHIQLAPFCDHNKPTQGFALTIIAGTTAPATGPFDITVYRWLPSWGVWAKFDPYSAAAYNDALCCYDVGGEEQLFFKVDSAGDGNIALLVKELP